MSDSDSKSKLLQALEADKKGEWDEAHQIVQSMEEKDAYWIHAYLHRKEPDISNASYWYRRAGRSLPDTPPDQEWQAIYDAIA